jgi:hypothetical protein
MDVRVILYTGIFIPEGVGELKTCTSLCVIFSNFLVYGPYSADWYGLCNQDTSIDDDPDVEDITFNLF